MDVSIMIIIGIVWRRFEAPPHVPSLSYLGTKSQSNCCVVPAAKFMCMPLIFEGRKTRILTECPTEGKRVSLTHAISNYFAIAEKLWVWFFQYFVELLSKHEGLPPRSRTSPSFDIISRLLSPMEKLQSNSDS